jgi:hypothetical protein|tara:strand:- start:1407 stop:1691 length:285 start_codon:yes stop_codon:yes gene_type:complete
MPKVKPSAYRNEISDIDMHLSDILNLQLNLATVTAYMENTKIRKRKCPHYDACIKDISKVQARLRKWRTQLEREQKQITIKLENLIPSVNEVRQ